MLRHWLTHALPARIRRWYREWLKMVIDELQIRAVTLFLFHAATRAVPFLGARHAMRLTLAHPVVMLHQLSWYAMMGRCGGDVESVVHENKHTMLHNRHVMYHDHVYI